MNAKEQPLISVIVPVYKVEKYLPACLDSLLAQTYQNFELLLVDDGSPDKCWEILQQYAAQDARVCIFRKENGGVTSARNFGLEQARGEYIGFADPDDAMLPQYLTRLYAALTQQDTSMAVCGFREVWDVQMAQALSAFVPEQPVCTITTANYAYGKTGSCSQCWRALYHREVLQQVRFDTALSVGEDTVFFCRHFCRLVGLPTCQNRCICTGRGRIRLINSLFQSGSTARCWRGSKFRNWCGSRRSPSATLPRGCC